jgi:hypothetical protein
VNDQIAELQAIIADINTRHARELAECQAALKTAEKLLVMKDAEISRLFGVVLDLLNVTAKVRP